MQYVVMIHFTLHVLPENKPLHHQTWGVVLMAACESQLLSVWRSRSADALMFPSSSRRPGFLLRLWDPLRSGAAAFRPAVADRRGLGAADAGAGGAARLRPEEPRPAAAAGRAALHHRLQVHREDGAAAGAGPLGKRG